MANDAGGRTDKVGNRYEKNCIIYTILQVVEEKFKSCSFEIWEKKKLQLI